MLNRETLALSLAACLLCVTTALTASAPQDSQVPVTPGDASVPAALPDDPSTPLFQATCIKCHDQSKVLAARRTKFEWEEIINKMIERGATGTGREFETVYDYLVRHFGKVYINTDAADDLCRVLGLEPKDAEAIIAHRDTNGAFSDVDAIKKVAGIDAQKIEAKRDAIAF